MDNYYIIYCNIDINNENGKVFIMELWIRKKI